MEIGAHVVNILCGTEEDHHPTSHHCFISFDFNMKLKDYSNK
ncbi:MAG: hypothetical protein ACR2F1_04740 [Nitrososphaeraceae archaeon]